MRISDWSSVVCSSDLSANNFLEYSLFVTIGCAWYTLLSLSLSQFMPYRLAQQELAEAIREIATFIRIKSEFYDLKSDTDRSFSKQIGRESCRERVCQYV